MTDLLAELAERSKNVFAMKLGARLRRIEE